MAQETTWLQGRPGNEAMIDQSAQHLVITEMFRTYQYMIVNYIMVLLSGRF